MPNRNTDELFQLIKSLDKTEKRNFKLFMKRADSNTDLKTIILFDALDKMDVGLGHALGPVGRLLVHRPAPSRWFRPA